MKNNNDGLWAKCRQLIWEPMDGWLFAAMMAIYVMSMFLLYSADGRDIGRLESKTLHTIFGFALLLTVARIRPQTLSNFAPPAYLLGVLLLLGVEFFGITVNGSTRWLNLGFVRLQPSEIMKIALPMMVAWFFQRYETNLRWYHYLGAVGLIIIPGALILKQPDLGTATLIMASGLFVVFFAGLPWKALLGSIVLFVISLPVIWNYGMHDYQKTRVLTLLNPEADALGAGWNIMQSKTAIGSGGIMGKGYLEGTQSHLHFLPEGHTDFIIAAFSEEFGLAGVMLLMFLYLCLLGRSFYIALVNPDIYCKLLAGALTMSFFVYIFVNAGMVGGILPVVGVPLPFISYGGTAIITLMAGFGLLTSLHTHHK